VQEEKYDSMPSLPIADEQELFGVINVNGSTMKTFSEHEIYFTFSIAILILSAVQLRKRFATTERRVA
jgi:signal transduction protein with GAF and PtsI domain